MNISCLMVMHSNAGYYVGREYEDTDCDGMWFPYDRQSDYFKTREEAELELSRMSISAEL